MSKDSLAVDGSTAVTIYGRTYHLRGDEQAEYLAELASIVDERMREVAAATGTADTLKVAILTSLNIADECVQASGKGAKGAALNTEKRLAHMVTILDEALAG